MSVLDSFASYVSNLTLPTLDACTSLWVLASPAGCASLTLSAGTAKTLHLLFVSLAFCVRVCARLPYPIMPDLRVASDASG